MQLRKKENERKINSAMTIKVTRERLKAIILNTEPDLTKEIVYKYTDSELKEWAKMLGYKTSF